MKDETLFDVPGPIARRRTIIGSVIAGVIVVVLVWLVGDRLAANGQFEAEKWSPFIEQQGLIAFLGQGILATLTAAVAALAFALILGIALAVGRLSNQRWLRGVCTAIVELFRGAPVLLMMLFFFLAFPIVFGLDFPPFWTVVLALTLFNGAVICEVVRAGVASLPRGQEEAACAIGMRRMQVLQFILLPQALRLMLPTLISQFVVLLKDTSLGFVVGYQELLQRSQVVQLMFNNPLQTFAITAVLYIIINSVVSRLSHWVSDRQARKSKVAGTRKPSRRAVEV